MIEAIVCINSDSKEDLLRALDKAKHELSKLSEMDAYMSIDANTYRRGETGSALTIDLRERVKPNVNTIGRCNKGTG